MTPREKAIQLEERFRMNVLDYEGCSINSYKAKQCALIAVDEIIKAHVHNEGVRHLQWWAEVKQEIEKL